MRRTKIEAIVAVIVMLILAVTGAVLGYHRGRSASVTSTGLAATEPHAAVAGPHPAVPESYAVPRQIPVLCFHGIGTPSPVPASVGNYNTTLGNFTAEMAYLHQQGYATITPQQYANWLDGIKQLLPAKPILLTFDGPFVSDTQATPVLEKYGFSAVVFVITGYANGDYGSIYAGWSTIQAMASEGWMIQLHAGECGHAFLPYAPYKARVTNDITTGEAAIQAHLNFPAGWQSTVFAAPFGAWGNGQNPWLISYWDSIFKTVFVQYIAASDQVIAHADHVRYRLELGYQAQSAAYLASHLSNAAFTRAGAGSGVTTGSANETAASG
jgi:peptidoglycan/xylan/chitin deacetylase (PgdA/CDA1 family)